MNQNRRAWLVLPCLWPAALALPAPQARAAAEPIRIALIEAMSGSLANAGAAVLRKLLWATERLNRRGGVHVDGVLRPLQLVRHDSKGTTEEAPALLRAALDEGISFIAQGNSSATAAAAALVDALDRHNARQPQGGALLLNFSAVDPALTNERCSFLHFRFDAHADMRLAALTDVLRDDRSVQRAYLFGHDYSCGPQFAKSARSLIAAKRPDMQIVGNELHALGKVKDFLPCAIKIKASGAQAVLAGNWGNDLTLLVKALREAGSDAKLYTFYGNALGAPAAMGVAGVGRVLAVAEWHPNVGGPASEAFYGAFTRRFPDPREDYVHVRMAVLVEMLAAAIERADSTEASAVARALEGARFDGRMAGMAGLTLHPAWMRAADHQLQQPLVVSVMEQAGTPGAPHAVEGSGYGFRTVRSHDAAALAQVPRCRMVRPD